MPDSVPLYHFLYPPCTTVYSGPSASSSKRYATSIDSCGWSDVPCLTIHDSFPHSFFLSSYVFLSFDSLRGQFLFSFQYTMFSTVYFLHQLLFLIVLFGIHNFVINKRFLKTIYSSTRLPSIMPPRLTVACVVASQFDSSCATRCIAEENIATYHNLFSLENPLTLHVA